MYLYLSLEELLVIVRALQTELSERKAIADKYCLPIDLNIDLIQSILEKIENS